MATENQIKNRKKWTNALRSGKYEQGKNQLKSDTYSSKQPFKYCCLGVACEIFPNLKGFSSAACLDDEFLEVFGIYEHGQGYFMNLNDTQGYSFCDIADEIDKLSH